MLKNGSKVKYLYHASLMKRLLICYLLLLSLGSQKVLADVFIVTTTLPTGDGSLRDALQKAAANRDLVTDTIRFNITRARDLIIRIPVNDLLPALSNNLVIDGTTQPGPFLGVSEAKVCVSIEALYNGTSLLYLFDGRGARNVKIYGLFLKGNVISATGGRPDALNAIMLQGSSNIVIGEPGKGNVISGWTRGVYEEYDARFSKSRNIRVQSNIFGLDTDGRSITFGDRTGLSAANNYSVWFKGSSNDFLVGGSSSAEGNIFYSSITDVTVSGEQVNDGITTISNNKFGIDYNGNNIQASSLTAIAVSNIDAMPNGVSILATPVITKNYIGGQSRGIGIHCSGLKTHFLVEENILGYEDATGNPDRNNSLGRGMVISACYQATIRKNIIRYWQTGALLLDASFSIRITDNSTYCNRKRAIEMRSFGPATTPPVRKQPFAYINRIDPFRGRVSGTSLPDNTIELFYNENCPTCEGKTLFATVTADANGDWSYNGAVSGDNVTATATDIFFATAEYSMPKLDTSALSISAVTCTGGLGSICGLRIVSGTKWRWEDAGGNIVGYDTCLRQVPAGRYFLKLSIGNSCEESFAFTIRDVTPVINSAGVTVRSARCGGSNGSICGISVLNGVRYTWEDDLGNAVASTLCFNAAAPGRYRLKVEGQQSCAVYSSYFTVPNLRPRINASNAVIIQPSCGKDNGSITGLQLADTDFATIAWYNDLGVLITAGKDLANAAPGRYKLVVRDNTANCGDSTLYFTLSRVPAPTMNAAGVRVTDATCGNSNGAITGITLNNITGIASYRWVDQAGNIIGTAADLLNTAPGTYRLKVKDGSNCDTLFSATYTIADRGSVSLDSSTLTIVPAGCARNTGGITGMKISGATALEWRNTATGAVVSTTGDLGNVPPGAYQLIATNSTHGCTARSSVYNITTAPPLPLEVVADSVAQATCGLDNGSIRLTRFNGNTLLFSFRWLKDSATAIGTGLSLSGLAPATYHFIATDTNGCERAIYKTTITALALPTLDERNALLYADTCRLSTGGIAGISASSDAGALQYNWYTAGGQPAGQYPRLSGVQAGDYYLVATDARGCAVQSRVYSIPAVTVQLPAPRYNQLINIARNADARITPLDSRSGTYELFDRLTGTLLERNTTGAFTVARVGADRELYVRFTAGPCSSGQTFISIKVFDETRLTIPNVFSPNNDGINDVFRIQVTGYFKLNYLKIFNRYGQVVHEVRDLNLPWDGTRNGAPLPVATYYWVLEGIDMNNKLLRKSGSITIIR